MLSLTYGCFENSVSPMTSGMVLGTSGGWGVVAAAASYIERCYWHCERISKIADSDGNRKSDSEQGTGANQENKGCEDQRFAGRNGEMTARVWVLLQPAPAQKSVNSRIFNQGLALGLRSEEATGGVLLEGLSQHKVIGFVPNGSRNRLRSAHLAMKARTLDSKGCQGFLASVMGHIFGESNIENLFCIRFVLLIDMAPVELKELKKKVVCEVFEVAESLVTASRFSLVILYLQTGIIMDPSKVEAITPNWPSSGGFQLYSDASEEGLGLCFDCNIGSESLDVDSYVVRGSGGYWVRVYEDRLTHVTDQRSSKGRRTSLKKVMTEAHSSPFNFHPGSTKCYRGFETYFLGIHEEDVATFVSKCMTCQQVKIEHQRASGLLQPLEIPMWKWDEISMDFVTGLPTTQKRHDAIWVVVDRLTKSAHFLPIRKNYGISKLAEIFRQEIVRLHGTPTSIVSDRDPKVFKLEFVCISEVSPFRGCLNVLDQGQAQVSIHWSVEILERYWRGFSVSSGASSAVIARSTCLSMYRYEPDMSLSEEPESIWTGRGESAKKEKQSYSFVKILWKNHPGA
ncbi:retrotransposable element Tf2 [Tanacetum coccineum]